MSEPLAQALRISGASLIMLTSIESRTTVWSAGRARVGADVAALGAAITEAAAEMVRLTGSGAEMDDLLVTSPANFHVLRVVEGQVAHLVLDRRVANLAMARREFRDLVSARSAPAGLPAPGAAPAETTESEAVEAEGVEAEGGVGSEVGSASEAGSEAGSEAVVARAVVPVEAAPAQVHTGPDGSAPDPDVFVPGPRDDEPSPVAAAIEGEVLPASPIDPVPADSDRPRLPQRRADNAWQDDPTAYQATVPALPGWLRTAAEGPFLDDAQTLDRVVGGLRRLE